MMHQNQSRQTMTIGSLVQERYKINKVLGRGGSSTVFLVTDARLEVACALKVIPLVYANQIDAMQEVTVLKQLHHPMLPRVIDVFKQDDCLCIVRDYVEGETLQAVVDRNGPLAYHDVLSLGQQLLEVLAYMHDHPKGPFIYRDMKPSNVICMDQHAFKLIDFGISRMFDCDKSMDTVIIGTTGYAAPEQYGKGQSDCRTDIYALGATLYFALTGDVASEQTQGLWYKLKANDMQPLLEVLKKAMSISPDQRYQNANDMSLALKGFTSESESKAMEAATRHFQKGSIHRKTTIGVASYMRGVGCTMIVQALAHALKKRGFKVMVIERTQCPSFNVLDAIVQEEDIEVAYQRTQFSLEGVTYQKYHHSDSLASALSLAYDYFVIDYGSQEMLRGEYLLSNEKIFVLPASEWHLRETEKHMVTMSPYQDIKYLMNLAEKRHVTNLKKGLEIKAPPIKHVTYIGSFNRVTSGLDPILEWLGVEDQGKKWLKWGGNK